MRSTTHGRRLATMTLAAALLLAPGAGAQEPEPGESACEQACYDDEEACFEACAGDEACEQSCSEQAEDCATSC